MFELPGLSMLALGASFLRGDTHPLTIWTLSVILIILPDFVKIVFI
jgi:hypothetical protein